MREIILDTETTGLDFKTGDRLVEIGCVELINHMPTNITFHKYLNPERDMPLEAFKIHGLSSKFLQDKPLFKDIATDLIKFIGDAPIIIHNAAFDLGFINNELTKANHPSISIEKTIDTVSIARKKYPGSPASLNALCRRFQIDNSHRDKHGALLDAFLLAEVYLHLNGGYEPGLNLNNLENAGAQFKKPSNIVSNSDKEKPPNYIRKVALYKASNEELTSHDTFMQQIKK